MSIYHNRGKRRKSSRLSRKVSGRKVKTFHVRGFDIKAGLSKTELREKPTLLKPTSGVDDKAVRKNIDKKRGKLVDKLKGRGGVRVRFVAPKFGSKASRQAFNIKRRGRLKEVYHFFPVLRYTIIQNFNEDPKTPREEKQFDAVDNYEVLKRYFSNVKLGAQAAWTARPPTIADRYTGDFAIRQTLGSFRRSGLDKKKLRKYIKEVEKRLAGYAVVTGIQGVWRSERSEQFFQRAAHRRHAEAQAEPYRAPKPSRKYKKGRSK